MALGIFERGIVALVRMALDIMAMGIIFMALLNHFMSKSIKLSTIAD